jgi:hypothetical protein
MNTNIPSTPPAATVSSPEEQERHRLISALAFSSHAAIPENSPIYWPVMEERQRILDAAGFSRP